jgi:hypothetical protein
MPRLKVMSPPNLLFGCSQLAQACTVALLRQRAMHQAVLLVFFTCHPECRMASYVYARRDAYVLDLFWRYF